MHELPVLHVQNMLQTFTEFIFYCTNELTLTGCNRILFESFICSRCVKHA